MYQLYGFLVINSLIDNALDKVSKIGELSPISRTFSSEVGIYSEEQFPDVRLLTFYSQEGETRTPIATAQAKEILQLGNWLATQAQANNFDADHNAFEQKLRVEFRTRMTIEKTGAMVTNGHYYLPEFITFSLISDSRENRYKIWFADEAFQAQYDKFELKILPPFKVVDDFYKTPEKIKAALTENMSADGIRRLHEDVNKIADDHPYTLLISNHYDWLNPEAENDKMSTVWTVLLYGKAANNADLIKDKLAEHVLKNSAHPRSEWEKILPDLFIPTEFYLCPFWTKFSTPNLQLMGGLHSPTVPFRDILPYAGKTMHGYGLRHIAKNCAVFDSIFKSIAIVACGHELNRLAPKEFEKLWPEYANIYTTSRDFNRISPLTQDFIIKLSEMLVHAEVMTPESDIPQGYTRIKRGDLYYLTASFNKIQYVMPLRYNFLGEIALSQDSAVTPPTVNPQGNNDGELDKLIQDLINNIPPGTVGGTTRTKPAPVQPNPGSTMTPPSSPNTGVLTPMPGTDQGNGSSNNQNGQGTELIPLDDSNVTYSAQMTNSESKNTDMFAERNIKITISNVPKGLKERLNSKVSLIHNLPNSLVKEEVLKDETFNTWTIDSENEDKLTLSTTITASSNNATGRPLTYVDGFNGPYNDKRATARFLDGVLKVKLYDPAGKVTEKELTVTRYSVLTTQVTG